MYGHVCFMQYRAERQVSCMYGHVRFMQYWDTWFYAIPVLGLRPRIQPSPFLGLQLSSRTPPRPSASNLARARPSPVLGLRPRIRPFPQSSSAFTHAITRVCIYILFKCSSQPQSRPNRRFFPQNFRGKLGYFSRHTGAASGRVGPPAGIHSHSTRAHHSISVITQMDRWLQTNGPLEMRHAVVAVAPQRRPTGLSLRNRSLCLDVYSPVYILSQTS